MEVDSTLKEEFPHLTVPENASASEKYTLLKQQEFYKFLAKTWELPFTIFQREQLEAFSRSENEYAHFTPHQKKILRSLMVASDIVSNNDEDSDQDKERAYRYMGAIGNLQKILVSSPKNKGLAFQSAASHGHLECVRTLIEKCGHEIPIENKRWALSVEPNHNNECIQALQKALKI